MLVLLLRTLGKLQKVNFSPAKPCFHNLKRSFLYFQDNPSLPEFSTGMLIVPQIGMFNQIVEVMMYIVIYKEIFGHDKYMFNSSVITKENYIKRKQKNSFTLAAQVLLFIGEGLFTFAIVVINAIRTDLSSKELTVIYRVQQFAFMTLLKIGCSQEIRQSIIIPNVIIDCLKKIRRVIGSLMNSILTFLKK